MLIKTEQVIIGGGVLGCLLALLNPQQSIICDAQLQATKTTKIPFWVAISKIHLQWVATVMGLNFDQLLTQTLATKVTNLDLFFNERPVNIANHSAHKVFYIIDQNLLHFLLVEQVTNNCQIINKKFTSYKILNNQPHVLQINLADGQKINTSLLLGADGRHSRVRLLSGYKSTSYKCSHYACVAQIKFKQKHKINTAWQLMSNQIIAFLPINHMQKDYCEEASLVWSMDERQAKWLKNANLPELTAELNKIIAGKLPEIAELQNAKFLPLEQFTTDKMQPDVLLMGDAANVVHPLAGQGLNLGIADAMKWQEITAKYSPMVAARKFCKQSAEHKKAIIKGVYAIYYYSNLPIKARNPISKVAKILGNWLG